MLLPFFTLLGLFLPLVDPSTPIPAPCMDPLKEKGVRGDKPNTRNSIFSLDFGDFAVFHTFWDSDNPW